MIRRPAEDVKAVADIEPKPAQKVVPLKQSDRKIEPPKP